MNIPANIEFLQQAGIIGTQEIILIVVVVLLLFGGKKIPELMRGMGRGVKEFKDGMNSQDDKNKTEESKDVNEQK